MVTEDTGYATVNTGLNGRHITSFVVSCNVQYDTHTITELLAQKRFFSFSTIKVTQHITMHKYIAQHNTHLCQAVINLGTDFFSSYGKG